MIDEGMLRLITALGHGVPGVTVRLTCDHGVELVVAANRLDAHLDPCQLRAAVLVRARAGATRLVDTIAAAEVHLGLQDLGATVVCITANHPSASAHLDAVASWAIRVCMVEELLGASRRELSR
jgi:hypothetical protein